ncbi:MAG: prepilin peptidase, partial [Campylobacteraceae bacterium]|nr:prepilin peptidase [Campylobacteraceae bacterium]
MIACSMFILGLIFGSFLNVIILRVPAFKSIAYPASHCVKCNTPLKFYHNIPLLSWLFLRGKCAFCRKKISIQYPLIEFLSGVIFLVCYFKEESLYLAILSSLVFLLLLALFVIDLRYKAVPDVLTIPALFLVLIHPEFLLRLENALIFAGGFALLRFVVSFVIKKEAMGEAD